MEMKKSISDTERALRSYGAVSETAWTTDKGESSRIKTAGRNVLQLSFTRAGFLFVYLFLYLCRARGALKWLIGDSQSSGTFWGAPPPLRGLLIRPHAHCGTVQL